MPISREAAAQGLAILATLTEDQLAAAMAILVERRRDGQNTPTDDFIEWQVGKLLSLSVQHR